MTVARQAVSLDVSALATPYTPNSPPSRIDVINARTPRLLVRSVCAGAIKVLFFHIKIAQVLLYAPYLSSRFAHSREWLSASKTDTARVPDTQC